MVTIHTRNIAVQAAEMKQEHTMRLAVRFMNTFLRVAINKRDVRTAYNLFNEHRALAESVMLAGEHELTEEIAERFKFYGQVAFSSALPFILETAAYDFVHVTGEGVRNAESSVTRKTVDDFSRRRP